MHVHKNLVTERPADDDEIDLGKLLRSIWRGRWLIVGLSGMGLASSLLVSTSWQDVYRTTATFMPIDSARDSVSSPLTALGALSVHSQGEARAALSETFVALLKSRSIADQVAQRHEVSQALAREPGRFKFPFLGTRGASKPLSPRESSRNLQQLVSAKANGVTGIVELTVDHSSGEVAAGIANAFLAELNAYLQQNSFTSAKRNRTFLEAQVAEVSRELSHMEAEIQAFQEENMLVSMDAQTTAAVQTHAMLSSQLMTKKMELDLLSKSVSHSDIQLIGLKQEVSQIQKNLSALETGGAHGMIAFKEVPKLSIRYAQLQRALSTKQKSFDLLTQQLELARVAEAKEGYAIQVIDTAIAPERPSGPRRGVFVLLATVASSLLGIVLALNLGRLRRLRSR